MCGTRLRAVNPAQVRDGDLERLARLVDHRRHERRLAGEQPDLVEEPAGTVYPDQPLVFDPMRLTDGIEPSADQILAARPKAYSVSIDRRCA